MSKNTYQSFLNISEPNKWDADNKIKNTFRELKKISNFFLDIKQANSFNIDSEKKIKTYNLIKDSMIVELIERVDELVSENKALKVRILRVEREVL